MRCSWFRESFRQLHMDFHMPEFPPHALEHLDADTVVTQLVHAQVDLVALFAKCHFGNAYYDTRIGHKHSALSGDYLGDVVDRCRKQGIRTLAYYSLCVDKHAYDHNPAWRYVDGDGQTYGGTFGSVCMNTPYKDELVFPQLEEIVSRYPVDGLFIDIPVPWGAPDYFCFCNYCRERWRREFNLEITPDLDAVQRQRLNMRIVKSWLVQMRDLVRRTRPELCLCVNIVGGPAVSAEVKELVEIGVWESQPRPGDYLGHSYAARTGRNDIQDIQVMTVRFYEGWGDMSLKPEAQLLTECAAILGNGMAPCVGDQMDVDGSVQKPVYDQLNRVFGFVRDRQAVVRDADPVRHTGILLPVPDRELPLITGAVVDDPNLNWKEHPEPWRGAHKMLVESHIQCDLLYSAFATDLQTFPLLILPEPGAYSEADWHRLETYVKNGGTLIATGNSILSNGRGVQEEMFGIEYVEPLSFQVAHFTPHESVRGECADLPLQFRGAVNKVVATTATPLADLWYPVGETQPPVKGFRHPCPPAAKSPSPYPFATLNSYGKGKAVYVVGSIFRAYWQTHHHWLRQFMDALIRTVAPPQPVEVDASSRIEVNMLSGDTDLLVNLIHYCLGHQGGQSAIAGIERVDPVTDVTCRVRCEEPVRSVVLEPEGETLDFSQKDGVCAFTVPRLEVLAMVRISF